MGVTISVEARVQGYVNICSIRRIHQINVDSGEDDIKISEDVPRRSKVGNQLGGYDSKMKYVIEED